MPRHPLNVEDLWSLPRVGLPEPRPAGGGFAVPVTEWSMEADDHRTRLWWVPLDGRGVAGEARPLTSRERSATSPAWDPEGRRLAFLRKPGEGTAQDADTAEGPTHTGEHQLWILDLEGGEPRRLTDMPYGVVDPRWFPDGRRIAFLSPVYPEASDLEATARRKAEREEDPLEVRVTEDNFYRFWDDWLVGEPVHHLFVLDLESGELQDLLPGSARWFDPMDPGDQYRISPDGDEIAFAACRSKPPHDPILWGAYLLKVPARTRAGGRVARPKLLAPRHRADTMRPIYSPDGRWIIYGMQRDLYFYADRVRLVAYDRRRKSRKVLTEDWDLSAASWTFLEDGTTLLLSAEEDGRVNLFLLDLEAALGDPAGNPPRRLARGGTFQKPRVAGDRILTTLSSLTEPPEVVSVTTRSGSVRPLTTFTREGMAEIETGEVEDVRFEGSEGREVQMFLVHPPGARKKDRPLPLVQIIHGGPHGITGDGWHWRWNLQAFAAPGYLVAGVNFHGSTSWGQAFAACIQGSWGRRPYEDIMAATDHLIREGLADPGRMAAAGGSYGGYLASWIASQTDRFACIVNHAGVCDFQTQLGSDVTQGDERAMGGALWDDIEGMDRWNPLRHARGFRSPMLVLHGEKDYRVPYYQGLQIYNVYRMMGLPARLVVYPEENHWILKPRASRHWYGEVLGWLERWLGRGRR